VKTVGAALVVGLVIGACAVRSPGVTPFDPRKNEITALWTQIRDWRVEAHLGTNPRTDLVLEMSRVTVRQAANVCPDSHVPPPACEDICSLASAICENAEQICAIAAELAPDAWSEEKCTSAKASCKEAKLQCCGCDDQVDAAVVP
jgi:hypothetical protein